MTTLEDFQLSGTTCQTYNQAPNHIHHILEAADMPDALRTSAQTPAQLQVNRAEVLTHVLLQAQNVALQEKNQELKEKIEQLQIQLEQQMRAMTHYKQIYELQYREVCEDLHNTQAVNKSVLKQLAKWMDHVNALQDKIDRLQLRTPSMRV